MTRDITAATQAEAAKLAGARPREFVKLEFDSGDVRLWSGTYDFTFDGEVYTGVGGLGEIGAANEGTTPKDYRVRLRISGVDAATVSIAQNEDVQGRRATHWTGFLDDDYQLVADPVIATSGRMDVVEASYGKVGEVQVTVVTPFNDWNVAREHLFTDADQKERFPGDLGFEFLPEAVDTEIVWAGLPIGNTLTSPSGRDEDVVSGPAGDGR